MPALVPLESTQLTTTASSVTFNNGGLGISQSYKGLHLRGTCEGNSGSSSIIQLQFGSLTSGYNNVRMFTEGSTATADSTPANRAYLGHCPGTGSTPGGMFGIFHADIFGYNDLNQALMTRSRFSNWTGSTSTQAQGIYVALRAGHTAVITSLVINLTAGSFVAGTTLSLYGWQ